jgi:transposase
LQLSSPAWKMKARDRFIGWSEEGRGVNLQKLVNHSRFLIVPRVHIEHLASKVLGQMVRQFPADWERAYGIKPLLLETVVSADQAGTCYRAANWKPVGETTGRGRMDREDRGAQRAVQQVFVYPLERDATKRLCAEAVAEKRAEIPEDRGPGRRELLEEKQRDIGKRYGLLKAQLDERGRRCWLGAEALALGRGGLALVAEACGVSQVTVKAVMSEVEEGPSKDKGKRRIRRKGGGSKPIEERMPGIKKELEKLVDPCTRGDPESPLRWTSKSHQHLADELTERGFKISADIVAKLLVELGYSLKGNRKTREGKQHKDRDAQFQYIAKKSREFIDAGDPVISVDTKKKEKIGNYKNGGREYEPKGHVEEVEMHDSGQRDAEGRLIYGIPYGVY